MSSFPQFILFILFLVILSARLTLEADEGFDYKTESDKGPEKWGDLRPEWATCKTGCSQSPVAISPADVDTVTSIGNLTRDYKPAYATLTGDPYVRITWNGNGGPIVLDKSLNFNLGNVHWHAPSEHTINGERYDLELHMVHNNTNPNGANKIAVYAYLYRFGPSDPFISMLMSSIKQLNETNKISLGTVDPKAMITSSGSTIYRYEGSITTPPCTEKVIWLVDSEIKSVSNEQVSVMRAAVGDDGYGNSRPVQPINDRRIIKGPFP